MDELKDEAKKLQEIGNNIARMGVVLEVTDISENKDMFMDKARELYEEFTNTMVSISGKLYKEEG